MFMIEPLLKLNNSDETLVNKTIKIYNEVWIKKIIRRITYRENKYTVYDSAITFIFKRWVHTFCKKDYTISKSIGTKC